MPTIEEYTGDFDDDAVENPESEEEIDEADLDPGQAPPPNAFRVLLTGFGSQPFAHHKPANPSWLAVKPLHNTVHELVPLPGPPPPPEPLPTPDVASPPNGSRTSPPPSSQSTPLPTPPPPNDTADESQSPYEEHPEGRTSETSRRPIHVSCVEIPVSYKAVQTSVPGFHLRPPVVKSTIRTAKFYDPPEAGYDFIFHIGVAGRGALRMERLGHKIGYQMKDVNGKLAKIVKNSTKDFRGTGGGSSVGNGAPGGSGNSGTGSGMNDKSGGGGGGSPGGGGYNNNSGSGFGSGSSGFGGNWNGTFNNSGGTGLGAGSGTGDSGLKPTRGFGGPAYESFPDEFTTDIDVTRLVQDLKRSGVDQIYTSMDAGHYLCDYLYYCSLTEAKRTSKPYEKRRYTQVLFMHCPPAGQPISSEDVTEVIRRTIIWVCNEIQILDDTNLEPPTPPQAGLPAIGRPTN